MLKVVQGGEESDGGTAGFRSLIDEIVRDGARKMLAAALQAEVAAYVKQFADQVDEDGRRLVVRNGYHQPRMVVTSAGAVEVKVPQVNDKRTDPETGERQRFSSAILPAWVFPQTKEQRCWFHKQANALAALPKSAHPGALAAMKEIYNAEDANKARAAITAFERDYGAKFPKAVAKIVDDADVLLEFYHYPAEHWIHLRTTNPIESTFATVRLRSKVTKGPGSRAAGLAMAFKLIEAAEARWRAVNAPHLVALVRAGAVFEKGKLIERPVDSSTTKGAA